MRICVYCASSQMCDAAYHAAATRLGEILAEAGCTIVYGGGAVGLMGSLANGALARGGKVIGIIPRFLIDMEATERELSELDELVVTENMHERKHIMFDRADAFVTLPGGVGTLEELAEQMTWAQIGRHKKPILILDVKGFWRPLLALFAHMREAGFIRAENEVKPIVAEKVVDILPMLRAAAERAQLAG